MAWIVTLEKKVTTLVGDPTLWLLQYNDPTTGRLVKESFNSSPQVTSAWIKDHAARKIEYLDALDLAEKTITSGNVVPEKLPVETPALLTETTRDVFVKALHNYQQVIKAVALKLPVTKDPAKLLINLQALWLDEYIDTL